MSLILGFFALLAAGVALYIVIGFVREYGRKNDDRPPGGGD
jgi:hypothetical protein